MAEFVMPSLGADMVAGTLVEWRRAVGDVVERGDIIADVETEKGVIEVEVFTPGVIERFLVEPGTKVPVGTPLAIIRDGSPAEAAPPAPPAAPETAPALTPGARRLLREAAIETAAVRGTGRHGVITREDAQREIQARARSVTPQAGVSALSSPLARRRARELGLDLADVSPGSPDGVIHLRDVEQVIATRSATVEAPVSERPGSMRRAIAAAMARSKREIPHYYLSHQVNLGPALGWLGARNAERGVTERALPGALLLRAAVLAVRAVPELNAHYVDGSESRFDHVHLGVAINLRGGGLVAPAIRDADRLPLDALMAALKDLVSRTRAGTIRSSEMGGATITVTSLGDRGVETVFPIIVPPQVAIVGFGKIVERPWSVNGEIRSTPVVTATLGADHRVTDGHRGAVYLAEVAHLLEHPEKL